MNIRFEAPVLIVSDIAQSREFYEGLLGQVVAADHGENVVYEGGLSIWLESHALKTIFKHTSTTHATLPAP